MINKYQAGGAAPQGSILQEIAKLPQDKQKQIMAAFGKWAQAKGLNIQQLQGNEQALEQAMGQFLQEMQQAPKARLGAKLNYVRSLRGLAPEGMEVEYYKCGGQVKKKFVKAAGGEKVKDGKKEIADFKKKKACKGTNIKVAYDCTEWADVTDGNAVKRFVKKHDEKLIRTKLADAADGLIVISSMMERQYQGCKAMVKLPPLVDIEDSIWHQQPEQHEGFEFCFAGQLDGLKESLDLVVKSFLSNAMNNDTLSVVLADNTTKKLDNNTLNKYITVEEISGKTEYLSNTIVVKENEA